MVQRGRSRTPDLRTVLVRDGLLTLGTLLFLVAAASLGCLIVFSSPQPMVRVPNLTNLTPEDALGQAGRLGLRAEVAGTRYDDTVPAGAVCATDPETGRNVRKGRLIRIYTSRGPKTAVVPDLIGRTLAEARVPLAAKRLEIGQVWKKRSAYAADTIVGQEPSAGTKLQPGSSVDLEVSGGPEYGVLHVPGDGDRLFRAVVVQLPSDGAYHRLVVEKRRGDILEAIHDRLHAPGESVQVDFYGEPGDGISVYLDERRVLDRTL